MSQSTDAPQEEPTTESVPQDNKRKNQESSTEEKVRKYDIWVPPTKNEILDDEELYFGAIHGDDVTANMTEFCISKTLPLYHRDDDIVEFTEEDLDSPIDQRIGDKSIRLAFPSKSEDRDIEYRVLSPSDGENITFR